MKLNLIILFLFLNNCASINSQSKSNCSIFLKPLITVDLSVDSNKFDILNYLDESIQLTGKEIKYLPKDVDLYNGTKKMTLSNGYVANVKFHLRFRKENLVGYKAFIDIGDNYSYFWELIETIKKLDKNNVNDFIYKSDKKSAYYDLYENKCCKRIFKVGRSFDKARIFEIQVAVN
ncbi:hypothetical protein [Yeosuana marina]|uniref:hypothetical protein n=1 Tax=Yeosuana marina TaxID=1565536 RepID=UPI001420F015|nr:hypothetical protein [Yeosuana marina]